MKIYINDSFITDNTNECEYGCYFLSTKANAKFITDELKSRVNLINVSEAKKLLNINENIKIVGITGTNGKTTTAAMIYDTLLNLGYKCGLSGTRGAFINRERVDSKSLTTSPIIKTLEYLSLASKQECEFFVMEVSSHAIEQERIEGLDFALKIFTNLSQDHLDYHKSMDEYARVKNSFLSDESLKLINLDDKMVKFNKTNSYTYSLVDNCDFFASSYELTNGIKANVNSVKLDLNLQGKFNLYNALAAYGAVSLLTKRSGDDVSKAMSKFEGVEGRMQVVSKNPLVIVDFAHTPDGMEKVLTALSHLNLVVVFGAGGDRDRTKRPKMGAVSQKYARLSIVTSDNPRREEPNDIIAEICTGMNGENAICEADRRAAIKLGLENLKEGEALVVLGKGDEDYQEIKGVKHHFSDKEVVLELL